MNLVDAPSIMVIGADSHFCYLMRRYVKKSAHNIIFAYVGDDVLALARREKPIAIILEVDQPDTWGWSVFQALKKTDETAEIPMVLCSWQDEAQRGIDAGAEACLRKPILYEDFLSALIQIGIPPRSWPASNEAEI